MEILVAAGRQVVERRIIYGRITKSKHAAAAFSGGGAKAYGGR